MPVPGSRLEAEVLLWREIAIVEPRQADGEEDGAHHHVKAVEAGRHEEGGTIDAALEAERRVIIFKRLNGAEHHAKTDGTPQALLRALALAMDQRVMRHGARHAPPEQVKRGKQRQAAGVEHEWQEIREGKE